MFDQDEYICFFLRFVSSCRNSGNGSHVFCFHSFQFVPFRRVSRVFQRTTMDLRPTLKDFFKEHYFQPSQGFNQVLGEDVWSSFSGRNKTKQNIQTGSRFDIFDECKIGTLDPRGWGWFPNGFIPWIPKGKIDKTFRHDLAWLVEASWDVVFGDPKQFVCFFFFFNKVVALRLERWGIYSTSYVFH